MARKWNKLSIKNLEGQETTVLKHPIKTSDNHSLGSSLGSGNVLQIG